MDAEFIVMNSIDDAIPESAGIGYALSFAQERIWFLAKLEPETSAYNIAGAVRLTGDLDIVSLRRSLEEIVERHETLRTSFIEVEGCLRQQIHGAIALDFVEMDLRDSGAEEAVDPVLKEAARQPFRLEEPGQLRVLLLRVAKHKYVLLVVMQHIIADGRSIGVLIRELRELYEARRDGRKAVLPRLDLQYVDYAAWQRELLPGSQMQLELEYWKRQMDGAAPLLELPADFPYVAERDYCSNIVRIEIENELSRRLREISQREGVTLYMTLLAAFFILLWKYTGRQDLVIGTPYGDRPQLEMEPLIGLFVNLLALRVEVYPDGTFRELLQRVKRVVSEARSNSLVPFDMVVEKVLQTRVPGRQPLVQVVFAWDSIARGRLTLGDLDARVESLPTGTAKFDLTLQLGEDESGVHGWLEYRTQLFTEKTISQIAMHYQNLLRTSANDIDAPVRDLEVIGPHGLEQIRSWGRGVETSLARGGSTDVLALFETQACVAPEAIALEWAEQKITYAQLDRERKHLAVRLRAAGLGSGGIVAICVERSPKAVVAMLAAHTLGAAYLSLDASQPPERLGFIFEDAGVHLLCTEDTLVQRFERVAVDVLVIDRSRTDYSFSSLPLSVAGRQPDDVAYVVYTSGSTGQPKGVCLSNRGLLNLCHWHHRAFQLDRYDRATQIASLAFDASVWEIWPVLTIGGTLCFVPDDLRLSPMGLRDWLLNERITVCFLPTPLAESIVALEWPRCSGLRVMLTGGDRLQHPPAETLPFALYNNYGPSECSVVASSGLVKSGEGMMADISIGRPVDNVQLYILDSRMSFVPRGVTGELFIGGAGVGIGYLGRPGMTAERFVPDPFGGTSGARLYRTGDLVSLLSDGTLRFVGRSDDQVKLRGFRIELNEIAHAITQCEGIHDVVVLLAGESLGQAGSDRLIAFVIPVADVYVSERSLAEHTRRHLPEYMVPSQFVVVDRFPINTNGKLDKAALIESVAREPARTWTPVMRPTEEIVAHVWSSLLGEADIGSDDNFFALGGHSLLVTQLTLRLSEIFRIHLPLRAVFDFPHLRDLAAHIDDLKIGGGWSEELAVSTVSRDGYLPLSSAQETLWFLHEYTSSASAYNIAGAVRLNGDLDNVALRRSLEKIVERHETLRTSFVEIEGKPWQRVYTVPELDLAEIDLRGPDVKKAVERELRAAAERPFVLEKPGQLRVLLLRTGDREHVLMVVMHHIISDGWSVGVLIRELQELYGAHKEDREPVLPRLELQYVDYASWQRDRLGSDQTQLELDYWTRKLEGALPLLELPVDFPRSTEPDYRGGTVRSDFDKVLSLSLLEFSRREGVTLYMTLLAAFFVLLWKYTGRQDLIVGTDVANRNLPGVENLVGLFVNQVVLRADVDGDLSFREFLAKIREITLSAYSYQALPFGFLVDKYRPQRDLSYNPIFQVIVIFQNAPVSEVNFSGLHLEPVDLDSAGSVFDLSLAFTLESDGILHTSLRHSALFKATTAQGLLRDLKTILSLLTSAPEKRIRQMEVRLEMGETKQATSPVRHREARFNRLSQIQPTPTIISGENLVKTEATSAARPLPVIFRSAVSGMDLSVWAKDNRQMLLAELSRTGALLFSGFSINSLADFHAFTRSISPELIEYGERSSPRTRIEEGIYTSTDHPSDQPILLHNEQSYTLNWPMKIWFYCSQPASSGGCTPIADSRKILQRLTPQTVSRFAEKQIMYVRNYGDGLGLNWPEVFQTDDRAVVEQRCRAALIEYEWKSDDRLRTRQVRPAIRTHPYTGETVWFNHMLFFHKSSLPDSARESILSAVREDDLPFNTFYGDGSEIEADVLAEIRAAYASETIAFPWQKGDILMLDNMLVAHGREPFSGPRKILVAMAEAVEHLEAEGIVK
jgi:amino acid adenylation domain-containing protein